MFSPVTRAAAAVAAAGAAPGRASDWAERSLHSAVSLQAVVPIFSVLFQFPSAFWRFVVKVVFLVFVFVTILGLMHHAFFLSFFFLTAVATSAVARFVEPFDSQGSYFAAPLALGACRP